MSNHVHTPTRAESKRRISRLMLVLTSAAFIAGSVALPASAAITPQTRSSAKSVLPGDYDPNRQPGGGAYGPNTCKPGYVWRDAWDGDTLCVTPAQRQATHDENPNRQPGGGAYGPSTCKPGYVWREAWDGDTLCLTPAQRQAAKRGHGRVIDNGPILIGIPGR
ncbi:hypothetical protein OHB36_16790 [Streptomyces sp. NBC_00320]|uniref:hypothetical protein n=1 Tax=Streptomyces sp. NBC_00320 TaxID=2975711 RepID=UPI0022504A72|nr:hypothetical protein [Streptomyces sp. NBC_00320]MCX5148415.1 hypothetical protein [Streptomyces sp. NBC_00320]